MKKITLILALCSLLLTSCGTVQDVHVSIDEVTNAVIGDQFQVVVHIQNLGTEERELTSIDIGDSYLEGMNLAFSDPEWIQEWDFGFMGFQSYDYQIMIPAGESLDIVYVFEAIDTGNFEGSLDVCIDTESDCIYNTIFTQVSQGDL